MFLKSGETGMEEKSIHKDKELAKAAIKGLTFYAGQIAHQENDDEMQQIGSLVDAFSLYWGVDEKRDRCAMGVRRHPATYRP